MPSTNGNWCHLSIRQYALPLTISLIGYKILIRYFGSQHMLLSLLTYTAYVTMYGKVTVPRSFSDDSHSLASVLVEVCSAEKARLHLVTEGRIGL